MGQLAHLEAIRKVFERWFGGAWEVECSALALTGPRQALPTWKKTRAFRT